MINFNSYPILKDNISTLKKTSMDDSNIDDIIYMTQSSKEAINFDDVKTEYIKSLMLHETPKSNDALFLSNKNRLVFVEFKNGVMKDNKKYEIRKKIYDSIIILTDILNLGISQLRNNMDYILVYNASRNINEPDVNKKNKKFIQDAEEFDIIAKKLTRFGNKEYICFGLNIFENYCFKNVHTYTEEEFEQYLKINYN